MTRDDILSMARKAGFTRHHNPDLYDCMVASGKATERFAALVEEAATEAANARANTSWTLMCEKMVAAENEACAKLAETRIWAGELVAAAIRARSKT
jgi:hypothetical protein